MQSKSEPASPHQSPQVEELAEQSNTSSQPANEEPTHFDDLIEGEQVSEQEAISATLLTLEQFQDCFIEFHGIGASFTGIRAIALPNEYVTEPTARDVARILYARIVKIPMLHFILDPRSTWIGDIFTLVVYAQGMRAAVSFELKERAGDSGKSRANKSATPTEKGEPSPEQVAALTGA